MKAQSTKWPNNKSRIGIFQVQNRGIAKLLKGQLLDLGVTQISTHPKIQFLPFIQGVAMKPSTSMGPH